MNISDEPGASDAATRSRMRRNATRHADAMVYTMNNTYLTKSQKILVEAWFQFPVGIFDYLLMVQLALYPSHYLRAFVVSYVIAGASHSHQSVYVSAKR